MKDIGWIRLFRLNFRENNFFLIFKFMFIKQWSAHRSIPERKSIFKFISRNSKIISDIISRCYAIVISNTKIGQGTVDRRSILMKRIAFEQHMFIQMEQSCSIFCLPYCTGSYSNFNIYKRNIMILNNV